MKTKEKEGSVSYQGETYQWRLNEEGWLNIWDIGPGDFKFLTLGNIKDANDELVSLLVRAYTSGVQRGEQVGTDKERKRIKHKLGL